MRSINAIVTAEKIIREHLNVKKGEEVVIVIDPETDIEMAFALAGVIQSIGAEFTISVMPSRDNTNAATMTKFIDQGLEAVDVLIGITRSSGAPCYSAVAQQKYYEKKLRSMSMVFRSLDHFTKGGATADYTEIARNADILSEIWRNGKEIHVTTSKGTDLKAPIVPERVRVENGFATKPGDECAFSDGEVFMYPVNGAEGKVVLDGPIYKYGVPNDPIQIEIKNGKAVSIQGNSSQAEQLKEIIHSIENADNFAEIAVGLNPESLINGDFEEEKKALGNVHVALGKTPIVYSEIHMDLIMRKATVSIDEKVILEKGKLRL